MFCGKAPCICNVKPKAEPKKRIVKSAETKPDLVVPVPPPSVNAIQDAMRADAKVSVIEEPSEFTEAHEDDWIIEDPVAIAALQAAKSLMHHTETIKHKLVLDVQLTPSQRAAIWKERKACGSL